MSFQRLSGPKSRSNASLAHIARSRSDRTWDHLTAALLILIGLLTLACLGVPCVERTQEARVLEVAREMRISAVDAGQGLRAFLVPHVNGVMRLQKPPLAYWLAAGAYGVFGVVNEWAGRVPFALAWIATSAATYLIGRRLFGGRAAFIAALGNAGCLMNVRYGTLAETDVLACLFTTLATWAFWCGIGGLGRRIGSTRPTLARAALAFHLGAAAMGFAAIAKGPPASFPFLFFLLLAALRRDWRAIGRWFVCGAPITFLLIAAPWYAYILSTIGYTVFRHELEVAAVGGGHRGSFVSYFAYIVSDTAPLSTLTVLALVAAVGRLLPRRGGRGKATMPTRDPRVGALLIWAVTILLPLCLIGQKQRHYLVPIIPPLMLLTGWYVDRALRAVSTHARIVRFALTATAALCAAGAVAVPIIGRHQRGGTLRIEDGIVAGALLAMAVTLGLMLRRRGDQPAAPTGAVVALAAMGPIVFLSLQLIWNPTLNPSDPRTIATTVRAAYGQRPVTFVPNDDLPLLYHLRTLRGAEPSIASGVPLIIQTAKPADALPVGTVELQRFMDGDDSVRICEAASASATRAATH